MRRLPGTHKAAGGVSTPPASDALPTRRTTTDGSKRQDRVVPAHAAERGVAGHSRFRKMNRPPGPFVWFTREMLESPAWNALPLAARRVLDCVLIEHMMHGGTRNGALVVTYADFERFGIRRKSIAAAIKTAVALGFLDVTCRGARAYGIARQASEYGLTWLLRCDGTPGSNRWRNIANAADAKARLARIT